MTEEPFNRSLGRRGIGKLCRHLTVSFLCIVSQHRTALKCPLECSRRLSCSKNMNDLSESALEETLWDITVK